MVGMRGAYGGSGGGGGYSNGTESQSPAAPVMTTSSSEIAAMAVHKVAPPPPRSTASKMKARVKETFFPDDPFRGFKGQPLGTQWLMAVKYLFPILDWVPGYSLSLFKSDLISGLTIASLAIPQARMHAFLPLHTSHASKSFLMFANCIRAVLILHVRMHGTCSWLQGISYAKLASLPPIIGLYSSFVPPMVYAVLGSSRDLAVGPVSIASLVMGSMLREAVSPSAEPLLFLQLAFTSTLFAGLVQASLGILRLGFIIDFLSKATLVGFMAGAAIIVSLQQLKALLGITHFTTDMGLVPVMASVFHHTNEWSWQTILMGVCFLVLLLLARHVSIKWPKLFWVSACAPLASVIISTLLVFLLKAQNHGISIIGQLKCGLNRPSWDKLIFDSTYLGLTMKTGLITGILSLTEGIAVGRTFASLKDYQVDGNKEMMAIGLMNVVGSCTSCYVTTGAFSRSAVNHNAGCKTAMSNVVMALTVMVTLLFLMPLFVYTPNVVLGAIIIAAVIGLIDFPAVYQIWKMDKMDFLVCVCAFAGVIFISVQEGLAIAVTNTLIKRWIEEESLAHNKKTELHFVILDLSGSKLFSAVPAIDTSGIAFLVDIKKAIEKRGLELVLVNPTGEVMEKIQRANEAQNYFRSDCLYLTTGEAVTSLSALAKMTKP
nr:unnamed protein product [Digitaria exilis]